MRAACHSRQETEARDTGKTNPDDVHGVPWIKPHLKPRFQTLIPKFIFCLSSLNLVLAKVLPGRA